MFELDLRSRAPVYEQLVEKIKELIINNVLKPDQQLPAVRVLASELTINPNTIQKAYRELEHRGYIYSVPGKGSFVKPAVPGTNDARLQALENELGKIISEMLYLGVPPQEIITMLKKLLAKKEGGKLDD
ncbi:MAG: GntR family transcriptional regulator [Pelotomaculaceae bacterium]|jgi:GntR family transcriptional regulator|uniref:HTH-type transcriptional repressor YtrA n=1 Tax=anaerobic digester metagenome TaxID=1263854 RepID=A0A485LWT6_9ZZZZ|nr:GntR family transcriptional regulator [Bacillota bacterium]HHU87450.1 GntR family transcriptional regulator [Peptococcaceae bacterium]